MGGGLGVSYLIEKMSYKPQVFNYIIHKQHNLISLKIVYEGNRAVLEKIKIHKSRYPNQQEYKGWFFSKFVIN